MNDTAIRVESLGKRYLIGTRQSYHTLRESLERGLVSPIKNIFEILRGTNVQIDCVTPTESQLRSPAKFVWALKNVSFDVERGQIVGVIGNNGAGKSTLLKILARVTYPSEGEAEVFGRVGSLLEVGTGFHPELSGRENIYLSGTILGMKKVEIDEKFDEIVAFAEVEDFIETPVKRYSSGMYMRLAFAIAAHLEPEILLVDEALAVGDAGFQRKCLGKMGDVAKRGRTVIFVSHQMFAIRTLCERALWLDGGQLILDGSASEVVREYENALLEETSKNSAVVERPLENIQAPFYLRRIEISDSQSRMTNVIDYNQYLRLTLLLVGECPTSEYGIEFRIYKETGEFACTGVSDLLHGIHFDKATFGLQIDIGPLILTNGTYFMSFRVTSKRGIIDSWDRACAFYIVGCHPFPVPREIKTPVCVIPHRFTRLR